MTRNGVTNWILVNHAATSLYSVIADGSYHATSVGDKKWKSLIHGSLVQRNYIKEGFNVKFSHDNLKLRIGVAGENYQHCETCDSVIGFGIAMSDWKWSSGHIRGYKTNKKSGVKILTTFGYIFVQWTTLKSKGFTTNDFKNCLHPIINDTTYYIKIVLNHTRLYLLVI